MAFPLFTTQMFEKLGFTWAGTLFACIATLMIPIPFVSHFPSYILMKLTRPPDPVLLRAVDTRT